MNGLCVSGAALAGIGHAPQWLLAAPLCLLGLVIAEDRAVRGRIGNRTWPSVGYARFLFGTNLYLAVRNLVLCAAVFAIAAMASSLVGR
ncbi:MAG: hypothetical protein P4M09_16275 [Devosia sp.]|nr:hypothetical protein [Devosia sp.]